MMAGAAGTGALFLLIACWCLWRGGRMRKHKDPDDRLIAYLGAALFAVPGLLLLAGCLLGSFPAV